MRDPDRSGLTRILQPALWRFYMQNAFTRVGIAIALVSLISAVPALAQQTPVPPQEQQQAKDPAPISGELVSLDSDKKTLTIKTDAGAEMTFSYSDATEILGADKGVSGLATMSGSTVTVTYKLHGTANVATKIEVQPKK
jgi:hypothetical protein